MIGSRDILAGIGAAFVILLIIGGIAMVLMMLLACGMSDAPVHGIGDCFGHLL